MCFMMWLKYVFKKFGSVLSYDLSSNNRLFFKEITFF
ncbi:hypothetical protein NP493_474g00000 [Ridgeia piscesae]|uniref:Uncharacterized protein n=1 Tax=Ridgeia piscesae TaxID=27915 RepID=A0AAD9NRI4_RIDPI|nr:hypothetical protein NP493_474g00000 [Ridgeia piscesae]